MRVEASRYFACGQPWRIDRMNGFCFIFRATSPIVPALKPHFADQKVKVMCRFWEHCVRAKGEGRQSTGNSDRQPVIQIDHSFATIGVEIRQNTILTATDVQTG